MEHWLDHAPAVAAHWARGAIRNFPIAGIQSTDEYWRDFSGRFDPRIIEKLLTTEREDVAEQLLKVLMGPPQQITIVADAPEFATAFAVAAIRSTKEEMREFVEARTLHQGMAETVPARDPEMVDLHHADWLSSRAELRARAAVSAMENEATAMQAHGRHEIDDGKGRARDGHQPRRPVRRGDRPGTS